MYVRNGIHGSDARRGGTIESDRVFLVFRLHGAVYAVGENKENE